MATRRITRARLELKQTPYPASRELAEPTRPDAINVVAADTPEALGLPEVIPSGEMIQRYYDAMGRQANRMAAPPLAADSAYALPTRAWLLDVYAPWFKEHLRLWDVASWEAEAHDCDDFAVMYRACAQVAHARHVRRLPGKDPRTGVTYKKTGFAVGEFWYKDSRIGAHAINVAVTADAGVVFVEPQTGFQKHLTPDEYFSSFMVKF